MRTMRLFHILDTLRGRTRPVSAAALASGLGVSKRTIYRDMATLAALGAPIEGEAGVGYQIAPGFFLPPLKLDEDELDVLVIGLRLAAARGDAAMAATAEGVLGKLNAVVADGDIRSHRPLMAVGAPEAGAPTITTLRRAIRARSRLKLTYEDLSGRQSVRTVRPLGLTAFESVWLLTAWCEHREDFRNFRVDRIVNFNSLGDSFKDEPGKRFGDYMKTL